MKRPNDFTKLDATGAARNAKNSNGKHSQLIVDGQCLFHGLHVVNISGGDRYVHMYDSRTLPTNGSKPLRVWKLPDASTLDHEAIRGRPFNEGLCIVISTTAETLTFTNADECILDCTFSEL